MSERLRSLSRIAAVQKRLVALADLRLTAADRLCHDLTDDQARLREFVATDAMSQPLAKATIRASVSIDRRLAQARSLQARQKDHRDALKRRDHTINEMVAEEKVASRRADEDRDLAEVLESWLALQGASLP